MKSQTIDKCLNKHPASPGCFLFGGLSPLPLSECASCVGPQAATRRPPFARGNFMRQSYFSKAEIAEKFSISTRTVDNFVARGLLSLRGPAPMESRSGRAMRRY